MTNILEVWTKDLASNEKEKLVSVHFDSVLRSGLEYRKRTLQLFSLPCWHSSWSEYWGRDGEMSTKTEEFHGSACAIFVCRWKKINLFIFSCIGEPSWSLVKPGFHATTAELTLLGRVQLTVAHAGIEPATLVLVISITLSPTELPGHPLRVDF